MEPYYLIFKEIIKEITIAHPKTTPNNSQRFPFKIKEVKDLIRNCFSIYAMGEQPSALVIFLKAGARVVADSLAYFMGPFSSYWAAVSGLDVIVMPGLIVAHYAMFS